MSTPSPRLFFLLAHEAVANLLAVAQRSVLALLGIVIGTASVIAMLNVGHNAEVESIRQFKSMGTDLIVAQIFMGQAKGGAPTALAIEDISKSLPSIRQIAPLSITGMRLGRDGSTQSSVIGATPSLEGVVRLRTAEGRFLTRFDTDETYAIVGAKIAASSKISAHPLHPGDQVRIGNYLFTIIGVLAEATHNPLLPFDINTSVIIPQTSMRRVATQTGSSTILAAATEDSDPTLAADVLGERLRALHGGIPVQTQSARQLIEGMQKQASIMAGLLAAIGSISLLVGGVGVMNVMLMNVAERRREIGLRMALGARRSHIRTMFLMEAALLSLTGGICGTLLGMLAALAYARYSGWDFTPSSLALPLGAVISAGVGLFFGAYPAASAARLDPIETLRAE